MGPPNPREFAEVTSTTEVLGPFAAATGGDARRLTDASGNVALPRIVAMRSSETYRGDDWLGLKMRDASVVRGIGVLPMFAGLLGLLLLVGALAATWRGRAGNPAARQAAASRLLNYRGGPIRQDRAFDAVEGAGHKLRDQEPRRIDRPGHGDLALAMGLKAGLAVVGLVADQNHQAMALAFAASSARAINAWPMPRSRNGGSTVRGPSSSARASPIRIGESRTEPTSSVPTRAVNESSGMCVTSSRMR